MSKSGEYSLAIKIAGKVDASLSKALGKTQSMLSKVGGAMGTMAKVGGAALTAATGAAAAFAKSSVDAGMQFDAAMSQVAATMGTTVDQIGDLRQFAMDMGSKTAFSATEAAEALNYMALAGYDAQTSMAMLPNVLNLAAAGGIDLAAASNMITDAQSALGLTLEETSIMVDQMARTSSKTNTSVEQLGEAILTVGGTAQYMAGGTAELNSVLGVLADNGIKGGEGGTHLRNMLLKLSSPTKDATKLLDRLGVQIFDAEGNMRSFTEIFPELNAAMANFTDEERLAAMSTLFNSRDIASATALLSTSTDRWAELGAEIGNAQGAAEAMANTQLDNLSGDITLFKSALEGAQITLSDQLSPSLREFVQFGTNGISEITTAFQDGGLSGAMEAFGGVLSDGIGMIVEQLPGFVDAGMQLLGALGSGLIDNLPSILDAGMTVLNALVNAWLQAQPAIFDAAVQIVSMLLEGFVKEFPQIAASAMDAIMALAESIAEAAPELLPQIAAAIVMVCQEIVQNLPLLLDAVLMVIKGIAQGLLDCLPVLLDALPDLITGICDFVVAAIPEIIDVVVQIALAIVDALPQVIDALVAALPTIITAIINGVLGAIPQLIQAVIQIVMALVKALPQIIQTLVAALPTIITAIIEALMAAIPEIVQAGIDLLTALIQALPEIITTIVQALPDIILGIINALIENIPLIIETGVKLFVALVENLPAIIAGIVQAIPQIISAIFQAFGSLGSGLWSIFSDAWEGVKSIFENPGEFFSGVWEGIKGAFGAVADWFGGIFTDAWTAVKNVFCTGGEIFMGIVDGILDGFKAVVNAIIDGINAVIAVPFDGINWALKKIHDVSIIGIKPFTWIKTLEVPQIPHLAKGGVVDQSTLLEAGEAGPEAIIPLAQLWKQLETFLTATIGSLAKELLQGLSGGGENGMEPVPAGGPAFTIMYQPQYHFGDGAAPSKDDLVDAERMSQEEFDRKLRRWMKDHDRKDF